MVHVLVVFLLPIYTSVLQMVVHLVVLLQVQLVVVVMHVLVVFLLPRYTRVLQMVVLLVVLLQVQLVVVVVHISILVVFLVPICASEFADGGTTGSVATSGASVSVAFIY